VREDGQDKLESSWEKLQPENSQGREGWLAPAGVLEVERGQARLPDLEVSEYGVSLRYQAMEIDL
jgi:hypothetical protein